MLYVNSSACMLQVCKTLFDPTQQNGKETEGMACIEFKGSLWKLKEYSTANWLT